MSLNNQKISIIYDLCNKAKPLPLSVGFNIISELFIKSFKTFCSSREILEVKGLYFVFMFSISLTMCYCSKSLVLNCLFNLLSTIDLLSNSFSCKISSNFSRLFRY